MQVVKGGTAQASGYHSEPRNNKGMGAEPRPAAPRPSRTAVDAVDDVPGDVVEGPSLDAQTRRCHNIDVRGPVEVCAVLCIHEFLVVLDRFPLRP